MEFYYSNSIEGNIITLDNRESRHCTKVLRNKIGDEISVVDGLGNLYIGELIFSDKRSCKIKIRNTIKEYNKKNYYIHIGISPTKNHDRLEWFVEKSVEIGVNEISLINCSRTLRKSIKMDRLNNIAIAAMKQSLNSLLPKINDIIDFEKFIHQNKNISNFICHLEKENRKSMFYYDKSIREGKNTCLVIGPEGDFTLDEIKLSKNNNFKSITLGENRLRTETAGIVACHLTGVINSLK